MSRNPVLLAAFTALAGCQSASAPQQVVVSCKPAEAGFALSDVARLDGGKITALLRGATVIQVRQGPDKSTYFRYIRRFRADGSVDTRYEGGPTPRGPWRAADGVVSSDAHGGSRDNGVWSAEGDRLCVQNNMTGDRGCYAVYASAGRYAWQNVDGPSCGNGPFEIVAHARD